MTRTVSNTQIWVILIGNLSIYIYVLPIASIKTRFINKDYANPTRCIVLLRWVTYIGIRGQLDLTDTCVDFNFGARLPNRYVPHGNRNSSSMFIIQL